MCTLVYQMHDWSGLKEYRVFYSSFIELELFRPNRQLETSMFCPIFITYTKFFPDSF